mgnify:CR=1 FL=1
MEEKFLYFAGIDGGAGAADATLDAGLFHSSRFAGVAPITTTTTGIYFQSGMYNTHQAGGAGDVITVTHANTTTTTGHRCKIIAQTMARALNAGPHVNGTVDVLDVDNDIYYDGFADIRNDAGFDIVITLDT